MDKIFIKELELMMSIGIYEQEQAQKQRVLVSVSLGIENKAGSSDDITDTVSYEEIANLIKEISNKRHYNLVESFAEDIASECLKNERVSKVKVKIEKPDIFDDARSVGIKIKRAQS